jgi:hypothetical protein
MYKQDLEERDQLLESEHRAGYNQLNLPRKKLKL